MKVGDLIQVSKKVHPSVGGNKIGMVTYVSECMPSVDVFLYGYGATHFLIESLEVINESR